MESLELVELASCPTCSLHACQNFVFGGGNHWARLVLVGEAPGRTEVREQETFIGPSGQLLWEVLSKHAIKRRQVYVTNALLCPVPDDAPVRAKDLAACRPRLLAELEDLPERRVILCLGTPAATALLGKASSITKLQGQVEWSDTYQAYLVYAYHPAFVLRNPGLYTDFTAAVQRAVDALENAPTTPEGDIPYVVEASVDRAIDTLDAYRTKSAIVCDLETTGLNPRRGKILEIGFRVDGAIPYILPGEMADIHGVRDALRRLFGTESVRFIGHNFHFDVQWLLQLGIPARVDEDTLLLHYTLDERSGGDGDGGGSHHDLKYLARQYCHAPVWDAEVDALLKTNGHQMALVPPDIRRKYHAYDLEYTWRLWEVLDPLLDEEPVSAMGYPMPREVYRKLSIPAANALADIEARGVLVDLGALERTRETLVGQIAESLADVRALVAGETSDFKKEFNPNSWMQVMKVLERLGYGKVKHTDIPSIHHLQRVDYAAGMPANAFLSGLLDYRSLLHTKTTYLDGIAKRVEPDGRVHSNFLQHATPTGRLASRNPNLQNLPPDAGVRDLFVAPRGYVIANADYKQLEVRCLYWYSQDPALLAALQAKDYHWGMCERVFPDVVAAMERARGDLDALVAVALDHSLFSAIALLQTSPKTRDTDPEELYARLKKRLRLQSKKVTFGVMYLEGPKSLGDHEKGMGVSEVEAARFLEQWGATYPIANRWVHDQPRIAKTRRWVESASGRRRRFSYPDTLDRNIANMAANAPIQSLASDICTIAMVKLNRMLPEVRLGNVLLSVHDSILMEVNDQRIQEAESLVRTVMTSVLEDDNLLFDIDWATGPNWGACH